jgi:hypothetical protein
MLRSPRDGANQVAITRPTSAIAAFLARVRVLLFQSVSCLVRRRVNRILLFQRLGLL